MTRTPSTLADLLADCDAHGIRLALADGGGLEIDAPHDALPPDLLDRLKAHKADLLAILQPAPEAECVDLDELTQCPKCGTLELWQSAAGDLFGLTPGRWRCMKCDPPTAARRLAEAAERIRRRANRRTNTRHKG